MYWVKLATTRFRWKQLPTHSQIFDIRDVCFLKVFSQCLWWTGDINAYLSVDKSSITSGGSHVQANYRFEFLESVCCHMASGISPESHVLQVGAYDGSKFTSKCSITGMWVFCTVSTDYHFLLNNMSMLSVHVTPTIPMSDRSYLPSPERPRTTDMNKCSW